MSVIQLTFRQASCCYYYFFKSSSLLCSSVSSGIYIRWEYFIFFIATACSHSLLYLLQPKPQSVPYREALSNRRILTSSTESREGLTQQVCIEKPSYLSTISLCFKLSLKIVSPPLERVKNMLQSPLC